MSILPDPSSLNPVDAAIASRRSVRAFLPRAVPASLVRHILAVSSRAPSGTNMQPWQVYALAGEARRALSADIRRAYESDAPEHAQEYAYYPNPFFEPYQARRRKIGWDLYGLLGIAKGDKARMQAQHARNFDFFGAPVGLVFTIDRKLEIGSWLDYGMFLGNVTISARGHGLDTCPQAAFARFHRVVRAHLGASEDEIVVAGMALGYVDEAAPENALVTAREPVDGFARFLGFEDQGDGESGGRQP